MWSFANIFLMYNYTNNNVINITGDGSFAKFLTIKQYIKLLFLWLKRSTVLPNSWYKVIEKYYKVNIWLVSNIYI
jgi:hypothetical protein